jgi:hypothetical protein
MSSDETIERVLNGILNQEFAEVSSPWQETFATLGPEKDTIVRGLDALERTITPDQECVLHGWIDQAVLELVARGSVSELRGRTVNYRADQGGDTGLIAICATKIVVIEFSFENGQAALKEYELPNKKMHGSAKSSAP